MKKEINKNELENNEAFAIYDAQSKTLTFHKNNFVPNVGDIYTYIDNNGDLVKKQVTEVYKNIEKLVCADYNNVPWEKYKENITYVEVVDEISPIDLAYWFYCFLSCEEFKVNKLDTSNVINMHHMFVNAGYYTEKFDLDLSSWNTSKVKDMSDMFFGAGFRTKICNINGLNNWNVSNVINMSFMFSHTGYNATIFNLNLANWNVSNVKSMTCMFDSTGYNAIYSLNLSSWDIFNVAYNYYFNNGVENKIIAPTWCCNKK